MTFHQGCCLCATGWSGEGFDFSPRNNQRLKLLRNATLTPHATPTKTERRGARCPAPFEIAALPFLWPTRLADGLELEVFYVWLIQPDDSPRAPLSGHVVPPRCRLFCNFGRH